LYVFEKLIKCFWEFCVYLIRDLRNNRLEEIDDDAFDGAESLNELYEIKIFLFKKKENFFIIKIDF
jgi:hypothetical protein